MITYKRQKLCLLSKQASLSEWEEEARKENTISPFNAIEKEFPTKSLVRCKVACLNTRSTPNPCSGYILKQQHCYLLTLEDWNETVENADIDTANGIPTGKLTPSIKIQSNPKLLPSCRETCLTLFLSLNLLNL